jgi:PPOX class probable F420-dependent enzyme
VTLSQDEAQRRFTSAQVARLATASATSTPHLVPVTFAAHGDVIVFAIDHKPKISTNLKRLRNIEENPQVTLLVDHYDDDWTHLWWARADGVARVLHENDERRAPIEWLRAKYPQYRKTTPAGPVVWIDVQAWRGWSYTP